MIKELHCNRLKLYNKYVKGCKRHGKDAMLTVVESDGTINDIFFSQEQLLELKDNVDKVLKENKEEEF